MGVDGSACSVAALAYGANIARAMDAPLEAITTWTYPVLLDPFDPGLDRLPKKYAELAARNAIEAAFQGTPPARFSHRVLPGPPREVLVELSDDASMLVLGSHGHGGLVGLVLGSVSAACAAHARCPVLVVHEKDTAALGVRSQELIIDAAP
ncbi:universal stress protein [Microbacterium sp. SD291]|uniref:universal stress protein n=1 Tax=Microbacterium sp. SD291 TaxID=2782007 RepID=UPI0027DDEA85|nr:universal stress protein [Microbacterium sp. SD291]